MRKKIKESRMSITFKWSIATSIFVFIIFTFFSILAYKTITTLMVKQERTNLERTMTEIINRLEKSDQELTIVSTVYNLKETSRYTESIYQDRETMEANMISMDSFISELSQPELSAFVYNTEEKLVFETRNKRLELEKADKRLIRITTMDDVSGFLGVEPVYSHKTKDLIGYVQIFYELSSFYEIRSKLLIVLIILEFIALIVSGLLGFWLSSYFLKPLKVMTETMMTIRNEPLSDVRMPATRTNDELSDLTEIFNEMLDRMQRYIESQEQFVQDVSHELRTPVAIIEGHLNLLNRWGKDDPDVLEESIQATLSEISRMKTLVQEMLDLSRVEQIDVRYLGEITNAKAVVHQIILNFELLYPKFNFILKDEILCETPVKMYKNHLEQLLIIILDNAVKYSKNKNQVDINIEQDDQNFKINIKDYGEGIPEKDINKIFNRFFRVDKARSRNKGGNGLGLSIAQKLVESYQGSMHVHSQVNEGTEFTILIPAVTEKEEKQ